MTTKTQLLNELKNCKFVAVNATAYRAVSDLINGTNKTGIVDGNTIKSVRSAGSGRYSRYQDDTQIICMILKKIGLEFEISNDSPKGGKLGTTITVLQTIERP